MAGSARFGAIAAAKRTRDAASPQRPSVSEGDLGFVRAFLMLCQDPLEELLGAFVLRIIDHLT